MRTYRDLFGRSGFTPLFLVSSGQVAGQTVSGLALGTLVYADTGSPLLSGLAMFGPALAQVVGAATLLSAADRLPPRAALSGLALAAALGAAFLAVPGLPVWGMLAVVLAFGALSALGGGVRYGLLNELLDRDGYLLGRSVLNMSSGIVQIAGFGAGGVLVTVLSPRGTLLVAAALHLAAATAGLGLGRRRPRASGRPSPAGTWRDNARLWSDRPRRHVYLALWLPNGLIVGCESLFVPLAPDRAGLLFACAAGGMLAGDVLVGRYLPPHRRARLVTPLYLLLALPYLVFVACPSPVLVALASAGFAATLLLQERLMALTPPELSGHALGLHSSGMVAMQGLAATLAGALAEHTSPGAAMAVLAAASAAVTLALAPRLRSPRVATPAQGPAKLPLTRGNRRGKDTS
ncbi:MFS transporter [Nonomuraea sp. NPDC001023]|uniref:MFS transporter n=1 Tax=unclassified Nonomuraea TaxID=2593643 RepID=UPI00333261DB